MEEEKETEQIKLYNRSSLYKKFKNGNRPQEGDFHDLINSTINKLDDGIAKSFKAGLELAPQDEQDGSVISLYEKLSDPNPSWKLNLSGEDKEKTLDIINQNSEMPAISITQNNCIGLNKRSPNYALDIEGKLGYKGRIGTYAQGEIKANGKWQVVLTGLKGVSAFELMANARDEEGKGKYALLHAVLLNAYTGEQGRIRRTHNYYSWRWWRRIRVRWFGTPFDYGLEMKTASDYGDKGVVNYHIATLL